MEHSDEHDGQKGISRHEFIIKTGLATGAALLAASTGPSVSPAFAAVGGKVIVFRLREEGDGTVTYVGVAKFINSQDTLEYTASMEVRDEVTGEVFELVGILPPGGLLIMKRNDLKDGRRQVVARYKKFDVPSDHLFMGSVRLSEGTTLVASGTGTVKFT